MGELLRRFGIQHVWSGKRCREEAMTTLLETPLSGRVGATRGCGWTCDAPYAESSWTRAQMAASQERCGDS